MFVTIDSMQELKFGSLMQVYAQSNSENAQERWPDLPGGQGLLLVENDFYQYLREIFFSTPGSVYCILEEQGEYVSALRLEPYRDGLLLEALETKPCKRRLGHAEALIRYATEKFHGAKIYSHVVKSNKASLAVHTKCGFERILEYAVYIGGSVNRNCCTLLYEK